MNKIGKLSLILSLLCVLLVFALQAVMSGWMPFYNFGFGFSLFFLFFGLMTNIPFLKQWFRSDILKFFLNSLSQLFLIFIFLLLLNLLMYRLNPTFDLTQDKRHSLSPYTQELLQKMDGPIDFYYFYNDSNETKGFEPLVREEVEMYRRYKSQINWQSHSVFKRPDLAKQFKVGPEESSLYIKYHDKIQRVSNLKEIDFAHAFLKLIKEPKKIYFLQGHQESSIKQTTPFGLSGIKEQLERLHYQVAELTDIRSRPQDMALLVIAGPEKTISDIDFNHIMDFFKEGGSVLIAADPLEEHNMSLHLKKLGLDFGEHLVFSTSQNKDQPPVLARTYSKKKHKITKLLEEGKSPSFFIATSIDLLKSPNPDWQYTPLLNYLPGSVGHRDLDADSAVVKEGELIASYLIETKSEPLGRMIVVGDSDFMNNQFYSQSAQFDFALGLFSYLTEDEDLLKYRSPLPESLTLILTKTQMNIYLIFLILPLTLIYFILALFMKLRRIY